MYQRRDRGGESHGLVVVGVVSLPIGIEREELRQLPTQDFRVPTEMVDEDLRGLLIFREIAALDEATGTGRVHAEYGRTV